MKKHLILVLIAGLGCSRLWGDAMDDLLKMSALYSSKQELYMEFDLVLNYRNRTPAVEKHHCLLSQDGTRAYYRALNTEYVRDANYAVFIDHGQKLLIVGAGTGETAPMTNAIKQFTGDTALLRKEYQVRYAPNSANTVIMLPRGENSEFSEVHITLNSDYTMSRIVYHYKTKSGAKDVGLSSYSITYHKQHFRAETSYFSSARYVRIDQDRIVPKQNLASYKVIDKRITRNH